MSARRTQWLFMCSSALAICLAAAARASADPIPITSGALIWTGGGSARLNISSPAGPLTITGGGEGGLFEPYDTCSVPECMAGSTVPLTAWFTGGDLSATAVYRGTTYEVGGQANSDAQANLHWGGSLTLPAGFDGGTLTSPFSFTGSFIYPTDPNFTPVAVNLMGNGTAALTFAPWPSGTFPGAFLLTGARYDFSSAGGPSPTPEPASMLLLATGLSGAFAARRRRRA